MSIHSSNLDSWVTVQERVEARSANGSVNVTWANVVQTWASVKHVRGEERFALLTKVSPVSYKVAMRLNQVITSKMRILWEGLVLDIHAVMHNPRTGRTDLDCGTGETNG